MKYVFNTIRKTIGEITIRYDYLKGIEANVVKMKEKLLLKSFAEGMTETFVARGYNGKIKFRIIHYSYP